MNKELRKKVKEWANDCKAKVEAGAIQLWDEEFYPEPKWKITNNEISFSSELPNSKTIIVFDEIVDEADFEDVKERMRFLKDWDA